MCLGTCSNSWCFEKRAFLLWIMKLNAGETGHGELFFRDLVGQTQVPTVVPCNPNDPCAILPFSHRICLLECLLPTVRRNS